MKAGLAAAMLATARAKTMSLRGDVLLTAGIDEENSSLGTEGSARTSSCRCCHCNRA
ncbi:MAG: hypothetical protein ACRCYY_16090 [Trueperaceae bacterium]